MSAKNKLKTSALITSSLSMLLIAGTTSAEIKKEQCAGIVKAGLNDCASSEHICAGMNSEDGHDTDWIWLPTGTCNKIVGTHILKQEEPITNIEEK